MLTGKFTQWDAEFLYPTEEDMKPVCAACKNAYNYDWKAEDCIYCNFRKTVDLCKRYAETLRRIHGISACL